MLLELSIANFAIIDELRVSFAPGMNVITGETGAGKSILLQALGLLCGKKIKPGAARDTESPIWVEALFTSQANPGLTDALSRMGLEELDEELLIRREILPSGRNRVSLNGRLLRVSDLQELAPFLVNIHSQFDTYQLLDSSTHFDFILGGGQDPLQDGFKNYTKLYQHGRTLSEKRQSAENRILEIERSKAHLEQEIEEIGRVSPVIGEEEELNQEHQVLANREAIQNCLEDLRVLLDRGEETSFTGLSYRVSSRLDSLNHLDPGTSGLQDSFQELSIRLEEFCEEIHSYANRASLESSKTLEEVEGRIGEIERLKLKYGSNISSILDYESQAAEKLFELSKEMISLEGLDAEIEANLKLMEQSGLILSKHKKEIGKQLESRMNGFLSKLALPDASFHVHFESYTAGLSSPIKGQTIFFGPEGLEKLEFLFSPHPSLAPKPLKNAASGGEISRVMLALKACFAAVHPVQSFIFDEIDTGIGGETAHDLAQVLNELSDDRQSIVITHLPQIAIRAQEHFKVEKESHDSGVVTRVLHLSAKDASEEIGRMMGVRADDPGNRRRMAKVLEAQSKKLVASEFEG